MRRIFYLILVISLVLGMMQIVLPTDTSITQAASAPPDDGVNGAYVQYITGNWTVTGTESYSDEIIVLSGNLTIQNGGSLTLKNITLAMNCTTENGTYDIQVMAGGALIITDGDNNPATTYDRSNITDSPFDTDDYGDFDYRYSIKAWQGSTVSINNSLIREAGFSTSNNDVGLYIEYGNNLHIQNSTIENGYYGIYLYGGDNCRIGYNEIRYCEKYGLFMSGGSYAEIYNNNIHHNDFGAWLAKDHMIVYNNYIHNNSNFFKSKDEQCGLRVQYGHNTRIFNNTLEFNGNSRWGYTLHIVNSDYVELYSNILQHTKPGAGYCALIQGSNNLLMYNNSIIDNEATGFYLMYVGRDTRVINNNISNNSGYGAYIRSSFSPSNILFKDNYLDKNSAGMNFRELRSYTITNNIITNCSGTGIYVNDMAEGLFSNNTINATGDHFELYDSFPLGEPVQDTVLEVINCSCDPSKTNFGISGPKLVILNFLHIKVSDNNSLVRGASVSVKNNTGVSIFNGETDANGSINYINIKNQTIDKTSRIFYDPHNISATLNVHTAYGDIEPTMNKSQTVNVHFDIDLPPLAARQLEAVGNGVNVDLNWLPSQSADLTHYLVYRNGTGLNWELLYNSSLNPPNELMTTWTDMSGASTHLTYSYKVVAVDHLWQKSEDSNIAKCGDWVVTDMQIITDQQIQLNGSLIIHPTGNLTLKNVDLKFNNSKSLEYGITVQPGGKVYVLDQDDNPATKSDRTMISAVTPGNNLFFQLESAELVMKNSLVSDCGSDQQLDAVTWSVDQGPKLMTMGEPASRGLYVARSKVIIENTEFNNNIVSVLLDEIYNGKLVGNSFSANEFGIFMNSNSDNLVEDNTFTAQDRFSIYLYNSKNNSIISNKFTIPGSSYAGVGSYGGDSRDNELFYNTLVGGINGINISNSGTNNNVSSNTFYYQQIGLSIYQTNWNNILENNFFNITSKGCFLKYASFNRLQAGKANWSKIGYHIDRSTNYVISDLSIENSSSHGMILTNSNNIKMNNCDIFSSGTGVFLSSGGVITITCLNIQKCTTGILGYTTTSEMRLINSQIFNNINVALKLSNFDDFILNNCTLNATKYNFELYSASANLINISYNQDKIKLDRFSKLSLYWFIDIQVIDWYGNPKANSNLQLRKVLGTLVFNGKTDSMGMVKWLLLHERTQFSEANERSTPHFITATYGNHLGQITLNLNQTTLVQVHLDNDGPEAKNAVLTPTYPTTTSDLILNYQYSDTENDEEGDTKIMWYVNGAYKSNYDNLTVIDKQYTNKGESWQCEIFPHDGAVYGIPMLSTSVTIQNTKPEVSNVKLVDNQPRSDEDLEVVYDYYDIDSDPEVGSQHKWWVNSGSGSGWSYSQIDAKTLTASMTKKGERWKCIVKPYDGSDFGTEVESAPVTIGNTPPSVTNAKVLPTNPASNETLSVNYEFYDLDSDSESGSAIKWFRNDEEQFNLENLTQVLGDLTKKGESWFYQIAPSDGEDLGDPLGSTPVVIGNTAPNVININILPINPTTADNLTVEYEFVDDDGDSESFETQVQWLRKREGDLDFAYTGLRVKTLSAVYTTKLEVWTCEVTPHDNFTYGKTVRAEVSVTILNSKPTVTDVYISPQKPNTNTQLQATYKYLDLDTDPEAGTIIRWYRDGLEITEVKNQVTVSSNFTSKGESWYFTVQPNDTEGLGGIATSNSVTIHNTPPSASELKINPIYPLGDDELRATYVYYDIDGDSESNPEINWFKNGIPQTLYDNKLEVKSNVTEKGDLWYYTLRVSDGIEYSEVYTSHYVIIENSKALILAMQPAIGKLAINETEFIEFSISAVDPDGDLLLFKWKLDRTTVGDGEYYKFDTGYDSEGVYNLTLTVQDVAKESFILSFGWKITVHKKNRAPTLEIIEPITKDSIVKVDDPIKFSILTSDLDTEDTPSITWYFDDVVDQKEGSSYTYTAEEKAIGDRIVKVVVTDGIESVEYSWNLTIEKEEVDVGEQFMGQSYDWWGLVLAIISGIAAIIATLFGFLGMRKKKSKLKEYMDKIQDITKSDSDPREKEHELKELRVTIRDEFSEGLIIENHYLILEREVDNAIGETRTEIVEERVAMPLDLRADVEGVLEDGVITKDEYQAIMDKIRSNKDLNLVEKNKLNSLMTRWMVESRHEVGAGPRTRAKKPERYKKKITKPMDDVESDDDIDDEVEFI